VLFLYAANSEVAWLFLLSYWLVAIVVASFFYALRNRRALLRVELFDVVHVGGFEPPALEDSPFDGDLAKARLTLRSRRGTIGPATASGCFGGTNMSIAAGVVTKKGHVEDRPLDALRRGALAASGWRIEASDPLGLFRQTVREDDREQSLVLPRFMSLRSQPLPREVEAAVTAPRAGHGTEIFGVREYRPGDPLRRIHWRSTARRGELIVREFEPPGVRHVGIFLDPDPPTAEAADQIARLAASEAWDCLRAGGRVTLWAPGCRPTRPDEERNLLALLEWLARYPQRGPEDEPAPLVRDAIAVAAASEARLLDAVEDVRAHGGSVRAWVVGEAVLESDIDVERAGFAWPL
jgi:uncharacterized protein (DUF58 family)